MKQVALGKVVFSLKDLLNDPMSYIDLIQLNINPEIFVRRRCETTDKYLRRLFSYLCRKGFQVEDAKAIEKAPAKAKRKAVKDIEVTVYKTESVLKSEASSLASDIIDKINAMCSVEVYGSDAPTTKLLLQHLEELRAKAVTVAHIASLLK